MNDKIVIDALKFIASHSKKDNTFAEQERKDMINAAREALVKVGFSSIELSKNDVL